MNTTAIAHTTQVQLEWSHTLCDGKCTTHAEAERAAAALGNGWRLPSIQELLSLVDYTRCNPAIEFERFPGTRPAPYWTSTTPAWDKNAASRTAWIVSFSHGHTRQYDRHLDGALVRAVRSLPAAQ